MKLTPRFILGDVDLTDAPYAVAFGAEFGTPTNVVQIIDSMLLDGQIERVTGAENRTLTIPVLLEATDMARLADAEAALANECAKDFNELTVDPGDGFGAATVYRVFRGQLDFQRDDDYEQNGFRSYTLTMRALPFGFSEMEVVDVAVDAAVTPTTVVISDGTSTSGWTVAPGPDGPLITSTGGRLVVTASSSSSSPAEFGFTRSVFEFAATRTLSATDFTATEYVTADLSVPNGSPVYSAAVNGVALTQVSMALLNVTAGVYTYRVTWRCRATAGTSLTLSALGYTLIPAGVAPTTPTFVIDNVQRSNQVPPSGTSTGRQSLRTLEITGSARTPGSAAIEHATQGLGDVIFYTSPELGVGSTPDLSRWFNPALSGTSSDNAANVSGKEFVTSTSTLAVFDVPAASVPSGPYLLLAKIATGTTTSVTWTASVVIGGNVMNTQTGTASVNGLSDRVLELGVANLPLIDLPAETLATVRVTVKPNDGSSIAVDEVWAFLLNDDAAITQVACGSGTPALGTVHNRLFIDSASLASDGREGLYVGTRADRGDAFHAGLLADSWETHKFAPPMIQAFVVTTSAVQASLTLRHTPAWFTHAGR